MKNSQFFSAKYTPSTCMTLFGLLFENFNLAYNLRTVSSRDLGLNRLTLTYDLLLKKIDTGHNF